MADDPITPPAAAHGREFAVVAWLPGDEASERIAIYRGVACWNEIHLWMLRDRDDPDVELPDAWLASLKPVPAEMAEALEGAEYFVSVQVGDQLGQFSGDTLRGLGLSWAR